MSGFNLFSFLTFAQEKATDPVKSYILTPKSPGTPRINGAKIFGIRPGHPFLFTIAASGERPMKFSAEGLPQGLKLDPDNGRISGSLAISGIYRVMLKATNIKGSYTREFRICVGDRIALTPPMGWNSYNAYGTGKINQELMKKNAEAW